MDGGGGKQVELRLEKKPKKRTEVRLPNFISFFVRTTGTPSGSDSLQQHMSSWNGGAQDLAALNPAPRAHLARSLNHTSVHDSDHRDRGIGRNCPIASPRLAVPR